MKVTYSQKISPTHAAQKKIVNINKVKIKKNSPSPTPKPKPEPKLTFTPTPSESHPPASESVPIDTGLFLMKQINDFRSGKGLSPLSTEGYTCAFAVTRAGEIVNGFNHDGFRTRIDAKTLPYPSYSSVAENIAVNSDSNAVVGEWINSPGHNENLSKDVPYGCVGKNGDYYVFEAWKP